MLQKTLPLTFGLETPFTDRGQLERTSVFRATTDPCQIAPRLVNFLGEMAAEKSFIGS